MKLTHTVLLIGPLIILPVGTVLTHSCILSNTILDFGRRGGFVEDEVSNGRLLRAMHTDALRDDRIPYVRLVRMDVHQPQVARNLDGIFSIWHKYITRYDHANPP